MIRSQAASLTAMSDAWRAAEALLRRRDGNVDLPVVGSKLDPAQRGHAVDDGHGTVARAIGPIAARSCCVPDGVSEWTTVTRSISGCSSR